MAGGRGGEVIKDPLEWKILGGQGCKSRSLLCEGYGYFPEPHSSNYIALLTQCK